MRLVAALLGLLALVAPHVSAQAATAHAVLHPFYNSSVANTASPIQGTVDFLQNDDGSGNVTVTVHIAGLQANKSYALHVHTWGNLDGYYNVSTNTVIQTKQSLPTTIGGHFNPFTSLSHGCGYGNPFRHAGDVGDVFVPDGTDSTTFTTTILYSELLDLGRNQIWNDSIIGRTVAIHEIADPCNNATLGGWVAIGVIGINNPKYTPYDGTKNNATSVPLVQNQTPQAPKATALIFNMSSGQARGYVYFWTGLNNETHMRGIVRGFEPLSVHGIHIHAYGNEDNNDTIGGHWTGTTLTHGLPPNNNRHWGDLGNVVADANGDIIFRDNWAGLDLISIGNPVASLLGRAIAIHEGPDDGTMNLYGPRYNFGVIGLAAPDFQIPDVPAPWYPSVARAQVILRPFYNLSVPAVTFPGATLQGNVTFSQNVDGSGVVNVTVMVSGLVGNRSYGLHVHQWGNEINAFDWNTFERKTNVSGLGGAAGVGTHLNIFGADHGCPGSGLPRHTGDVGNVTIPDTATAND